VSNRRRTDDRVLNIYYISYSQWCAVFCATVSERELPPPNDLCSQAIGPLQSDGSITEGESKGATVDMNLTWGMSPRVGYGVWYTVKGTGHTMIASLGGVEFCTGTFIGGFWPTVFAGDCYNRTKVGEEFGVSRTRHSSAWRSNFDALYYVYVYTHDDLYLQHFNLAITTLKDNSSGEFLQQGAKVIQSDGKAENISGRLSSFISPIAKDGWGDFQLGGYSAWYKVLGDGDAFVLQRIYIDGLSDDIHIGLLHIVGDRHFLVEGYYSQQRGQIWITEKGEWYHIEITQKTIGADKYAFSVAKDEGLPVNDVCQNAVGPLAINGPPIPGSATNATHLSLVGRPDPSTCLFLRRRGKPGVWYTVNATGNPLTVLVEAHNKTRASHFDYTTWIFTGEDDCRILDCKGSMMEKGKINYILVQPKTAEANNFEISVQELLPPDNNNCINVWPLSNMTQKDPIASTFGTFENVLNETFNYLSFLGLQPSSALGVWYQLIGTGQKLTATLSQEKFRAWATQKGGLVLSVFTGNDCDSLVCLAGCPLAEAKHSETFDTAKGKRYWILVHSNLPAFSSLDIFNLRIAPATFLLPRGYQTTKYYTTSSKPSKDDGLDLGLILWTLIPIILFARCLFSFFRDRRESTHYGRISVRHSHQETELVSLDGSGRESTFPVGN
jgi:hypothetical protein